MEPLFPILHRTASDAAASAKRGRAGGRGDGGDGEKEKKKRKRKERKKRGKEKKTRGKRQFLIRAAFYPPPVCGTARRGVVFRLLKGCTGTRVVHGFTP